MAKVEVSVSHIGLRIAAASCAPVGLLGLRVSADEPFELSSHGLALGAQRGLLGKLSLASRSCDGFKGIYYTQKTQILRRLYHTSSFLGVLPSPHDNDVYWCEETTHMVFHSARITQAHIAQVQHCRMVKKI
jgi:hypothetical protein